MKTTAQKGCTATRQSPAESCTAALTASEAQEMLNDYCAIAAAVTTEIVANLVMIEDLLTELRERQS